MPAVSFSGTGFLYPYQIGCAEYIKETFEVDQLSIACISGGFTAALSILFNMTPSEHFELLEEAKQFWYQRVLGPFLNSTSNWIGPYFKTLLHYESQLQHINRNALLTLGCTSLIPYKYLNIDYFHSVEHLAYSISCSQRLFPFYRTIGLIEKKLVVDGVFSQRFAIPKMATREQTVTVSPFRVLLPDIHPRGMTFKFVKKIYTPPSRSEFFYLVEHGYQDACQMTKKFLDRGFKMK